MVELINLTPTGVLRFALPKVHLGFTTFFAGEPRHHSGQLDAVIIEPDKNRVMLVWQSLLACHDDVDYLDNTRIFQKMDLPLSPSHSRPTSGAGGVNAPLRGNRRRDHRCRCPNASRAHGRRVGATAIRGAISVVRQHPISWTRRGSR